MSDVIHKYYVDMIIRDRLDGKKVPLYVIWNDCAYKIEKIRSATKIYSKNGESRLRYECIIYGRIRYIFLEMETKWYIESYVNLYNSDDF